MELVIEYGLNALLGIGAVWAVVSKFGLAKKYVDLAKECVGVIDEIIKAVEDGKISSEEVKKISAQAKAVKEAFLLVRNK